MARRPRRPRGEQPLPGPPSIERHLDRLFGDIGEQDFKTIEEARAFIARRASREELPDPEPTPLRAAQDLVYDAWEAPTKRRRVTLARRALDLCPDCADAYLVLVDELNISFAERRALSEAAVRAAERALGSGFRERYEGVFWGTISTRPWMRARCQLAQVLWMMGEGNAAIDLLYDLLALNPNDNQGVRYICAAWLLAVGDHARLARLLDEYKDENPASFAWPRALMLFRLQGDTENARAALQAAIESNRHLPDFLLGSRVPSVESTGYYSPGREDEAAMIYFALGNTWRDTPGARAWLRRQLKTAD